MSSAPQRIALALRVYLEDTDAQGVVYHASFLRFLERARSDWLRMRGLDHAELREVYGCQVVLSEIRVRFRAPARLDEALWVSAGVIEVRGARIVFAQEVRRDGAEGTLLCAATADVACVDAEDHRPRRVPDILIGERKP